jgi:diguanylate cyclase (GGDEF)-like protein/PAS domain S-box-containing protein
VLATLLALAAPWILMLASDTFGSPRANAAVQRALVQSGLGATLDRAARADAWLLTARGPALKAAAVEREHALQAAEGANAKFDALLTADRAKLAAKGSSEGLLIAIGISALVLVASVGMLRSVRRADAKMRAVIDSSLDLVTIVDARGGVMYHSPGIRQMLGFPADVQIGTPVMHLLHPDDTPLVRDSLRSVLNGDGVVNPIECRWRHADGSVRWLETVFTNLLDDPEVNGIVLNSRDVTERHKLGERLRRRAFHDPLTGLANRARFEERLGEASGRADTAVLFIDLDNFKTVNDSLGHAAGDRLLSEVAHRLTSCVRMGDMVARMGGDEFAILLTGLDAGIRAPRIAERILRELAAPVEIDRRAITPSASIGIASGGAIEPAEEILRDADLALYEAKRAGKGQAQLYRPVMHAAALEQLELETDMRLAIEREEFVLHYQPQFRLTDGELTGYEALMRWEHPTRGLLHPGMFIELAEQTGLIVPLTRWALQTACKQLAVWRTRSSVPLEVSVNLSFVNLKDYEILDDVSAALESAGIAPNELVLEITESTVSRNHELSRDILQEFKKLGVRLALDDFGTGHSSLSRLSQLPFDSLKIPRPFIQRVTHNDTDFALTRGIVDLGHHLDLSIVAEGIENTTQLATVRGIGCELAQGFHLATPAAADSTDPEADRSRAQTIALDPPPSNGATKPPLEFVRRS